MSDWRPESRVKASKNTGRVSTVAGLFLPEQDKAKAKKRFMLTYRGIFFPVRVTDSKKNFFFFFCFLNGDKIPNVHSAVNTNEIKSGYF